MLLFEDPFSRVVRDLSSPDAEKRAEALVLLGQFDSNQARPLYIHALRDQDEDCRFLAAIRLARAQDMRTVRLVQTELDKEVRPQYRVWMRLVAIGFGFVDEIPAFVDDLCAMDRDAGEGRGWTQAPLIARLLADIGEPVDRQLCSMAKHTSALIRWIALLALQQNMMEATLSVIREMQFDADKQIRDEVEAVMEGHVRDLYEYVERHEAG